MNGGALKLVVGLGNPGRRYQGTRHNVGWQVLARLAERHASGRPRAKFDGEVQEATVGGHRALLLCPLTYMNASGRSVRLATDYYQMALEDILVICDDFNLPVARLRVRAKGSAGGQKGLADIIRVMGSEQFARLRIGIGTPPPRWQAADYVLGKFNGEEQAEIQAAVDGAADAVALWLQSGVDVCMNKFNAAT